MKRKFKRLLGALALCAVLAACALLPTALAWVRDYQQRGAVRTTEIEPITMGSDEQYSLIERFQLVSEDVQLSHDIQFMSFSTGVNYDRTTALQNMQTQVDALHARGLLPLSSTDFTEYYVESVEYAADSGDPARSLMAWTIDAMNEEYLMQAFMDDESGLLLALWVSNKYGIEEWGSSLELTDSAQAWADYLGLTLQEGYNTLTREYAVVKDSAAVYDEQFRKKYGLDTDDWRALRATLKDGKNEIVYRLYCVNSEFGIVVE